MRALYSLNIFFYGVAIRIASLFNAKAKLWVKGRVNVFDDLQKKIGVDNKPVVWFHCASLGEFEQGRPLIESFRKENPQYKILLTFFSPSGFEVRKNYAGADIISYLPLDTPGNAKRFLEIIKPSLVFFVKYEFWLNFLGELRKRKISHFLISAIFRNDQVFFKSYGKIFRDALKGYSWIFTQEKNSIELLKSIGVSTASVAGDTRFDRVSEIAAAAKEILIAEKFSGNDKKVLVAGSTWEADEKNLFPAFKNSSGKGWKLIIAPHELGEAHLSSIEKGISEIGIPPNEIVRFSRADEKTIGEKKVLIIDNVGMLSSLYRYGKIAYIGGGFGKSIHNILEAAVYGMPVIFGPRYEKFYEAQRLLELGGAICVNNENELENQLDKISADEELLKSKSIISHDFVKTNCGATKIILEKTGSILNH
jgi:3-deoxy-D-manno-octulosonic-acid transferase